MIFERIDFTLLYTIISYPHDFKDHFKNNLKTPFSMAIFHQVVQHVVVMTQVNTLIPSLLTHRSIHQMQ